MQNNTHSQKNRNRQNSGIFKSIGTQAQAQEKCKSSSKTPQVKRGRDQSGPKTVVSNVGKANTHDEKQVS